MTGRQTASLQALGWTAYLLGSCPAMFFSLQNRDLTVHDKAMTDRTARSARRGGHVEYSTRIGLGLAHD